MDLVNICKAKKASDLIVDLKQYFGVQHDRELVEIALTLTGIVVNNAENGIVVIQNAETGQRTSLELKLREGNVISFPNLRRRSLEVVTPHSHDDCA